MPRRTHCTKLSTNPRLSKVENGSSSYQFSNAGRRLRLQTHHKPSGATMSIRTLAAASSSLGETNYLGLLCSRLQVGRRRWQTAWQSASVHAHSSFQQIESSRNRAEDVSSKSMPQAAVLATYDIRLRKTHSPEHQAARASGAAPLASAPAPALAPLQTIRRFPTQRQGVAWPARTSSTCHLRRTP